MSTRTRGISQSVIDASESGTVYVVHPQIETLKELVKQDVGGDKTIKVIATDGKLRDAFEHFNPASRASQMVADGLLELSTTEKELNTMVVTDSEVSVPIHTDEITVAVSDNDPDLTQALFEECERLYDSAGVEPFKLRDPPRKQVLKTMEEELGAATKEDFLTLLGDDEDLGVEKAAILAAAKNELLFYDLSRWAEDNGVASKATFSRKKNDIEDAGLIGTDKVPVNVGRPRQRLNLQLDDLSRSSVVNQVGRNV